MGLRDLFTRAGEPTDWTELWTVLRPLGGRITPDSLDRMLEEALRTPRDTLVTADEQLGRALLLLDTEEHARHLSRDAWIAPEERFGRRRFVRAMHAVLAAGPDALARVVEDPAALRSYDSADTPSVLARIRDESIGTRLEMAINTSGAAEDGFYVGACSISSGALTSGAEKRWPSLDDGFYLFDHHDPEGVWLTVTIEMPQDTAVVGDSDAWDGASDVATERLMTALGDRRPLVITEEPLREAWIELAVPDEDSEPEGSTLDDGDLYTVTYVDPTLFAGVQPARRADVLARLAAAALLGSSVTLTPDAEAALHRLTSG
ncbi:hypothetical protein [Sanguibacter sp. 25GB23B1]|uniref:hypothetical protein n=1 Tax=unclassified Sanguibacter TaxID=2645534 RepID=UPI0032AF44FD